MEEGVSTTRDAQMVAPGFGFDPGPPCTPSLHVKKFELSLCLEFSLYGSNLRIDSGYGSWPQQDSVDRQKQLSDLKTPTPKKPFLGRFITYWIKSVNSSVGFRMTVLACTIGILVARECSIDLISIPRSKSSQNWCTPWHLTLILLLCTLLLCMEFFPGPRDGVYSRKSLLSFHALVGASVPFPVLKLSPPKKNLFRTLYLILEPMFTPAYGSFTHQDMCSSWLSSHELVRASVPLPVLKSSPPLNQSRTLYLTPEPMFTPPCGPSPWQDMCTRWCWSAIVICAGVYSHKSLFTSHKMVMASVPLPVLKLSTPKNPFRTLYLLLELSSDPSNGSFSAQGNWYRRSFTSGRSAAPAA